MMADRTPPIDAVSLQIPQESVTELPMAQSDSSGTDDTSNEAAIDSAYHGMMTAPDTAGQRYWCDRMTALIKLRSQARIREMEKQKGLCR